MSLSKSPKAVCIFFGFDLLDPIESFPQFLFGEHLQGDFIIKMKLFSQLLE
jgi:hypothetical protein